MHPRGVCLFLVLALAAPAAVHAHGQPAELAFWGGFPPTAARCQRTLSRATALCISQVAAARAACFGDALDGATCDETALDATVTAARQRALERVDRACTVPDLQNLGYIDLQDAFKDVGDACRQIDIATTSAAFGPALVAGSIAQADEVTTACVEAGARESLRLLRFAMRAYQKVLDRIAALDLPADQKDRLVEWATRRIERAQASSRAALATVCAADDFALAYRRSAEEFLADVAGQAACMAQFVYVQDGVGCPMPVCGNGMQELPAEECDDANDFEGDGCRADCVRTECAVFPATYDLIQRAIFENRSCTNDACHGNAQSGGLDLRAGASYDNLVDVFSSIDPNRKRVEPGDPQRSLLYLKLAAKTFPEQYPAEELGIGTPMPSGTVPGLSEDELEAVRLWIYAAASRSGTAPGAADHLHACSPAPRPIQIKPLAPPPAGQGVQLHMPPWIVDAHSEHEVCFASYYDVTDQVPAELLGPDGQSFCYKTEQLRQDPLSHHLIINRYVGEFGPDHPGWGEFRCVGGPRHGEPCVATERGACGTGFECATAPIVRVGCSGVGPPDPGPNASPFAGAQETNATSEFPDGAVRCVPLKGMVMWNSHAFNLTDRPGKLEAWVNFTFARPEERLHYAEQIFNLSAIFKMLVPACQQQEVCNFQVMPQGSHLFELTSHMHQRGKRWRTFRGRFRCRGERDPFDQQVPCDPLNPTQCSEGVACVDPDDRDPMASLIYTNFLFNDPVQLRFDPPLLFSGDQADRTLTYCALYDNGFTDPTTVKRQSTSPPTPFGTSTCQSPTHCVTGKACTPCNGTTAEQRNRSCDSSPGAGDGLCDACTLTGGVTTEDEMFLLLGSFYR
jgi:cysteine-rich repeat protein